ncbi:MAG TPA: DUF1501 domain-containing protein [Planctomycetota bacterium]|nr:DUF1501 domain-containing protein [Planctomycetota bacterium]
MNRFQSLLNLDRPHLFEVPKSVLGEASPRMVFSPRANGPLGDVLIVIFQRGGIDGLSAVVPYGDGATYYDRRKFTHVPEPGKPGGGIALNAQFALHPALQPLKEFFDLGQLAIVHATGSPDPSRSHFDAERFMEIGAPGNKTVNTGWIGRHLETSTNVNESPFRAVGIGSLVQSSLRTPAVSALALPSIKGFRLRMRGDQVKKIQPIIESDYHVTAPATLLERQAKTTFDAIATLKEIASADYTPANGATYPDNGFGRGLRQIAQLIKADVGLEIACIDIGGWDTHSQQGTLAGDFNNRLTDLAQGISAVYRDLQERAQNLTIVTMSEFGRRADENGSKGTDHGHGNAMFVLGGGVNGGQIYVDWPGLAKDQLDDGDLAITTDYRDVLADIVQKRLMNPLVDQIFPGHTITPLNITRPRT